MVGRRIDRTQPICTGIETLSDFGCNDSLLVSLGVYTLEVREPFWIRWRGLSQVRQRLNNDMSVSDDEALIIELLRSGKVVLLCVDKVPSVEVLDGHLDVEFLVGRDVSTIGGECELGRGHLIDARDEADRRWVA